VKYQISKIKKTRYRYSIFLFISVASIILPMTILFNLDNETSKELILSLLFLGYPIFFFILGLISQILKLNIFLELIILISNLFFIIFYFLNSSALIYIPLYIFFNLIATRLIRYGNPLMYKKQP